MSGLGASRFSALLAALAISGMVGTFWWALETRSDMKAASHHHRFTRALPAKFTGRVTDAVDNRPGEPGKFELMGRSQRIQAAPQSGALVGSDPASDRAAPQTVLANYPNPDPAPSPDFKSASLPVPDSQAPVPHGSLADMPLPVLPAPPPTRPDPSPLQASLPDPPALGPRLPASPHPAENPKRPSHRSTRAGARRAPKPTAQSYYTEKYFEQGEYHYRRRPCQPPNMPDVCFMPPADRQPVLAARP